jgi:maleate isomerase
MSLHGPDCILSDNMTNGEVPSVRLGLVVPGDCHLDDEFWALADGAALPFVTRTIGADDTRMGGDSIAEVTGIAEGPEIGNAADRLRDVAPMAAAYVDTSISFVRGIGGDLEMAGRIHDRLGCPAIVTSTAIAAGLHALGARRVIALSPYTADLDARLISYFGAHDITVTEVAKYGRTYPGGTTSRALGRTTPDELLADVRSALAAAGPGLEGILLACTAVRTATAVPLIEAATGLPVVSAVSATMWAVLRLAGVSTPAPRHGRLHAIEALPDAFVPVGA